MEPFLLLWSFLVAVVAGASLETWPLHNDSLNDVVQWDHYSLQVNGQRLFLWSGEFHYWRLPVPEMWLDIMQKMKAAGFNAASVYGHWAFHAPSPNTTTFAEGAHNVTGVFESAKQAGIYIDLRAGPYVNAETNGGGFPFWVTTGGYGQLRNNDSRYTAAWTPYYSNIASIASNYSVTKGGSNLMFQIENEYDYQWLDVVNKVPNWESIEYMELLEACVRAAGIDIPTFTNSPNDLGRSWSLDYDTAHVGGDGDIYGFDSYPQCWTCNLATCEADGFFSTFTVQNYAVNWAAASPSQPAFLPEFQGGSYNPWGGVPGGCANNSGPDFVNVFYRGNIEQRATMHNLYMSYGGTNWGGLPFPDVGTSYDYSAPIEESRYISDKYYETKLLGLQLRVARDLLVTETVGNGTSYSTNPVIWTTELQNPDTLSRFYFTRHAITNMTTTDYYKLNIATSEGNFTIPQSFSSLELIGHESKILSTDYPLGGSMSVVYSTAEILAYSSLVPESPLLVVWVPSGGTGEVLLKGLRREGTVARGAVTQTTYGEGSARTVLLTFTQQNYTSSLVHFADGLRVLIVDRQSAYRLWAPNLSDNPYAPDNQTIITTGPYLVRIAALQGASVAVTGDIANSTLLEVFGPSYARSLSWNGRKVKTSRTWYGSLIADLQPAVNLAAVTVPALQDWRVMDGLPERLASYDDSKWTRANHTSTPNYYQPDTFPVLYAEEYGIGMGNVLWRGRFNGTDATGVFLSVSGGTSMGYSAYLNGAFIGSWRGSSLNSTGNLTLSFDNATLSAESDNVLFVIQDHMGKDETSGALIPRGIFNATLMPRGSASMFSSWTVAGTAGTTNLIDPVRGPLNEGGLHAERLGWHLPGFDDSCWPSSDGPLESGISTDGAVFYRTVVNITIPEGVDATIAFVATDPGTTVDYRVQLYMNGYQYGKFVPRIGPQTEFPVPPGIVNFNGENTIGVSVWAQDVGGAKVDVQLKVLWAVESGFNTQFNSTYLRPSYTDRSQYY